MSRTKTMVHIAAALMFALFMVKESAARDNTSVVPGLLYGSGPTSIIDQMLPDPGLKMDFAASVIPIAASGCGGAVGKTGSASGPVGVSTYLQLQDDPNCDEFWGPDKWRHVAVWFGGSLGIYLFFKSVLKTSKLVSYILSATVMSVIGIAREISDANSDKNCFSEQDLFANTVGILAAGVVIAIF